MNQFGTESADFDSTYGDEEGGLFTDDLGSDSADTSDSPGDSDTAASDLNEQALFTGSFSDSGYIECTDVSVEGDAIYCLPEDQVCSGVGDAPAGYACPLKGEVAVENCQASMMSFLNGECVAPRDSICQKIAGSSWGCVWDDQLEDATATATTTTTSKGGDVNSNTNTRTGKGEASAASCSGSKTTTDNAECTNVRVDGDATFCVTGLACSGDGDSPIGDRCPVMGDVAVGDCHDYLASYSNGKCIAASDGVCKRASTGTWGCVWSSRDNAASYVIDTSDGNTTGTGTGSDQALVTGVAAAAAVAAVIAGIAVAWSRHKRQNQRRALTEERIGMVLTPPGSARGSFHRV